MPKYLLSLFNTETRKKEEIIPLHPPITTLYTCGPTVYDFAHIGNFRTYLFEDLLRRTLKFFGYTVKQAMNLTDVDDKTLKGAIKKNITLDAYTAPYKKAFFEDLHVLNIEKAEYYPEAVQYIPKMIEIIEVLLKKGYAYIAEGNVYFSLEKFPRYGRLSHLRLDSLQKTERIASDEYEKENISDFVLWKAYDPERDGDIFWKSPFGNGRPGWHIECSAMSLSLLGETIDIHCGGVDNIFPHHENEIVQSEAYTGKQFVRMWAHSEHLLVDGKKMSKSLGNFYTLRDLLKAGFEKEEVRYALISSHYRTQLNFSMPKTLEAARASLERIRDFLCRIHSIENSFDSHAVDLAIVEKKFCASLADDLNISEALAVIFDLIREGHILADENKLSKKEAVKIFDFFKRIDQVLGFVFQGFQTIDELPAAIVSAIKEREIARQKKDFAKSDEIRDTIQAQGFFIEDSKEGPRVKRLFHNPKKN